MSASGEDAADVACALEAFPFIDAIYALPPVDHPDAFAFAIVLSPYGISELVQAHYALVSATGGRAIPGRILYIDAAMPAPPFVHARGWKLSLGPLERQAARARVESRKERAKVFNQIQDLAEMERAFRKIAEQAERDTPAATKSVGSPYRGALAVSFGGTPILEIVSDPFPPPKRLRVLVADHDPTTAERIATLGDVEIIVVDDAWTAVDRLTNGDVDLAICSVSVGGISGAKIHKLVATARPDMARRIVYLASETAVSQAPPSSASGRVLARPIAPSAVRSLLDTLGRAT